MSRPLPRSIDETLSLLTTADYVADRALATVLFLSLRLKRPLFLEGEAGVGKTEIAKVLSTTLGRPLIRLQCYEGLDVATAVYEWTYPAQMMAIRLSEAAGHFRETTRLEPDNGEAHLRLALCLLKGGDQDGAASEYSQALRLGAGKDGSAR